MKTLRERLLEVIPQSSDATDDELVEYVVELQGLLKLTVDLACENASTRAVAATAHRFITALLQETP